ncbi:hypothetical protein CH063_06443 [Colletotrichum higginsianum]|nr:hypothetical protein CH063_06443 [Colletotrichum higginsianum]
MSSATPAGCFHDALNATALASSSRQLNQPDLMVQAIRVYGKAITGLNEALQSPVASRDDSVLVALFVLGLFEVIAARPSQSRSANVEASCHPHSEGGLAMLQYRSGVMANGNIDKVILAFFSFVALSDCFMTYPGDFLLWSKLRTLTTPTADGPCFEPLLCRAVEFKIVAEEMMTRNGLAAGSTMFTLLESGMRIIEDLKTVAEHQLSQKAPGNRTGFNGVVDVSLGSNALIASSLYLTVRLQVIDLMVRAINADKERTFVGDQLDAISRLGISDLEILRKNISTLLGFTQNSAADEPQSGRPLRAWFMLWPMVAVMNSDIAHDDTKLWAKDKLRWVGSDTGIGLITSMMGQTS